MTNDESDVAPRPMAPIKRFVNILFVIGAVGWLASIGIRYAGKPPQPTIGVGKTNILRDFGMGSQLIANDEQTLDQVMFVDCEDAFLPILSAHRVSDAIGALNDAIGSGQVTQVGAKEDQMVVEILETKTWDPQYNSRLLDKPDKLKIKFVSGDHGSEIGWVSSHWVK